MKWIKMKHVLKEMTGRYVEIVLSSELSDNLRCAVEFDSSQVLLCLNLKYAKDYNSVVESISHEIAHVQCGHNNHDADWEAMVGTIRRGFVERMGENEHCIQV